MLQLPLLKDRYKTILLGAIFQYVHGIFTQLAHRMHRPQAPLLHDLGFQILPVCPRLAQGTIRLQSPSWHVLTSRTASVRGC